MNNITEIRNMIQADSDKAIEKAKAESSLSLAKIHSFAIISDNIEYIKFRASGIDNKRKIEFISDFLYNDYKAIVDVKDKDIVNLLAKNGIYTRTRFEFIIAGLVILHFLLWIFIGIMLNTHFNHIIKTGLFETIAATSVLALILSCIFEPVNRLNFYKVDKQYKKRIHE